MNPSSDDQFKTSSDGSPASAFSLGTSTNSLFPSLQLPGLFNTPLLSSSYFSNLNPYSALQAQLQQLQLQQPALFPSLTPNFSTLGGGPSAFQLPQSTVASSNSLAANLLKLLGNTNNRVIADLLHSISTPLDPSLLNQVTLQRTLPDIPTIPKAAPIPDVIQVTAPSSNVPTSGTQMSCPVVISRKRKSIKEKAQEPVSEKKPSITDETEHYGRSKIDRSSIQNNYRKDPFVLAFLFLIGDMSDPRNLDTLKQIALRADRLLVEELGVKPGIGNKRENPANEQESLSGHEAKVAGIEVKEGHPCRSAFRCITDSSPTSTDHSNPILQPISCEIPTIEEITDTETPPSTDDSNGVKIELNSDHPDYNKYEPFELLIDKSSTDSGSKPLPLCFYVPKGIDTKQFPPLWYGKLEMKSHDTHLGLYYIGGNRDLFIRSFGSSPGPKKEIIKINQRLTLDQSHTIAHKFNNLDRHVTAVGVTAGMNPENCLENQITLKKHFIDYFDTKKIAGIALTADEPPFHASRVHIFAPGPMADEYLRKHAPSLYDHLLSRNMSFLFFVISPPE